MPCHTLRIGCYILISLLIISCQKDDEIDEMDPAGFDEMLVSGPEIMLNPSGRAPLAARIDLQTEFESSVQVTVLGDPAIAYELKSLKTDHAIPVVGLYPDTMNRVIVELNDSEQRTGRDTFELKTEAIPDFFPELEIVEEHQGSGSFMTLAELSIGNMGVFHSYPVAFDSRGNIRWYLDLSFLDGIIYPLRFMNNGNICFGRGSTIYEYDWLGFTENTWSIDGYNQHHEIIELGNGNLILAVSKNSIETVEDHIIEIDRATGAVVREWDMRKHLDVDRFDLIENAEDWFHMNAIFYDAQEESLVVSGRNQGLVEITYEDELKWIMAPQKGWGKAGEDGEGHETSDYLLTAIDQSGTPYDQSIQQGTQDASDFSWVWGQHAPMILSNGNLFVFDNGFNRNFEGEPTFSRGVEYQINESERTVQQVWEYGSERGISMYSSIISDVDISESGTRILTSGYIQNNGTQARIVEVSYPDKEVLFEAKFEFKNALSGGSGWGNIDIVYRSERFNFFDE